MTYIYILTYSRRYVVRLYDCALHKKVDVVVDDRIPCHGGSREPLYAQHKGNEMYILLLEKAFAKFAGGYANLVGGYSVVAWMALTGCEEQQYWERSDDGKSWAKSLMEMDSRRERPRDFQNEFYTTPADDERDADKFFEFLAECDAQRFIMGAGIDGDEVERERADGLVERHAYSLIGARRAGASGGQPAVRLVQLRNPWGDAHEWNGAWADGSPEWKRRPDVAAELGYETGALGENGECARERAPSTPPQCVGS